ncbi:hypothetical protein ScPMuIL_007420 [Solemya velum]
MFSVTSFYSKMGCGSSHGEVEETRTIVVFGATGLLGGSVVQELLTDPLKFRVRAVTRRPSSDKSRKLAEAGAVIVTANFDDTRSLERALEGAHGVFLTTHFWEDQNKEKEVVRGLNAIDAAIHCGVKFIVLNGSESIKKNIGKPCGHLDAKAAIEEYIRHIGEISFTIIRLPFWYENFLTVFKPHRLKRGRYALPLPLENKPIHAISVEDVGRCVMRIFEKHRTYSGRTIGLSSERIGMGKILHSFKKHIHHTTFVDSKMRVKDYENFNFPGSKDVAAMFEFYQKELDERDLKLTRKLNPHIVHFDRWLHLNKDKIEAIIKDNEEQEEDEDK